MIYHNVVIGMPLSEPWELIAVDKRDWGENEKEYTLFTETRYLPAVLKEAGLVQSTREVRRNRPDLCVTFAEDRLDCLDIKLGKKRLWVVVGAGSLEVYKKLMVEIDKQLRTVADIFEEFSEGEKDVLYYMVGRVLKIGKVDFDTVSDWVRTVYSNLTDEKRAAVDLILAEAAK